MVLQINIEEKAERIESAANNNGLFIRILYFILKKVRNTLSSKLYELTLLLEGLHNHISELNDEEVKYLLAQTKATIKKLDRLDEKMVSVNYLDENNVKQNFKNCLTALYRLESLLHVRVTKGVYNEKTASYIKEGLANLTKSVA